MIFYIFISSILTLLLALAEHFDTRRPMSTRLKYDFRVKDDSILRKIIKFKDRRYAPRNYFKIVPIYVYSVVAILSVVLLAADLITDGYISKTVPENAVLLVSVGIFASYLIYLLSLIIWWEIVHYREFKLTKEEKEALKEALKKRRTDRRR